EASVLLSSDVGDWAGSDDGEPTNGWLLPPPVALLPLVRLGRLHPVRATMQANRLRARSRRTARTSLGTKIGERLTMIRPAVDAQGGPDAPDPLACRCP